MERENSAGIARHELPLALRTRRQVLEARKVDTCLLCRRDRVNEAGLCDICYSMLDGEEANLAARWLSGEGP